MNRSRSFMLQKERELSNESEPDFLISRTVTHSPKHFAPEPVSTCGSLSVTSAVTRRLREVSVMARLALRLLRYVGLTVQGYFMFLRLVCFSVLMLPLLVPAILRYLTSAAILRDLRYGKKPRNTLDVYLPNHHIHKHVHNKHINICTHEPCSICSSICSSSSICTQGRILGPDATEAKRPVIIAVTGGAWVIGHKAWLALLGERMAANGVVFISLDYRNFPQGCAPEMVEDVEAGITYVLKHLHLWNGDCENVYLFGQSAGAHILTMSLIERARKITSLAKSDGNASSSESCRRMSQPTTATAGELGFTWTPKAFKAFVAISCPFDLVKLLPHLNARGFSSRMFNAILKGDVFGWSPTRLIQGSVSRKALAQLPPFKVFHGAKDATVGFQSSVDFARCFKERGGQCELHILEHSTHSSFILEGPLKGEHILVDALLEEIRKGSGIQPGAIEDVPIAEWKKSLVNLAQVIMPF